MKTTVIALAILLSASTLADEIEAPYVLWSPAKSVEGSVSPTDASQPFHYQIIGNSSDITQVNFVPPEASDHSRLSSTSLALADPVRNLPGWPVIQGSIVLEGHNSFVVGDVAPFPGNEAICTSNPVATGGKLYIFSSYGRLLLDYWNPHHRVYNRVPSLADMDCDGDLEIVIGFVDDFSGGLLLIDWNDGEFSVSEIASGYQSSTRPVVLADLDGNCTIEIIEIEWGTGIIHARNASGSDLPGWPVQPMVPGENEIIVHSPLAVGDMDGDGLKEVVVQLKRGRTIYAPAVFAFRADGSLAWSYQTYPDYVNDVMDAAFLTYFNDVVLGDVDNDGFLEAVYFREGGLVNSMGGKRNYWKVFDYEGNIKWQFTLPCSVAGFYTWQYQQLALADMDGDNDLEIVQMGLSGNMHSPERSLTFAAHHNGALVDGFPTRALGSSADRATAPMIADVNKDGQPDLVSSLFDHRNNYLNRIYACDAHGNLLPGWPKALVRQADTPLICLTPVVQTILTDLDGNGTIDLIAPIGSGESHAIDLEYELDPSSMEWPMFRHDVARTGCYVPRLERRSP